jgi:PKD repeat protein
MDATVTARRRPLRAWAPLAGLALLALALLVAGARPGACLANTPPSTPTPQTYIYLPMVSRGGSQVCFSAEPRTGPRPLAVRFTNTSIGLTAPYTATWQFGDGQVASGDAITHTYQAAGAYTVTLTLETKGSRVSKTETNYIIVSEPEGGASFTATPRSGASPLAVQFTDTTPGQASTPHYWTFGDGTSSAEVSPRHTYTQAGQYTVTLTLMTEGENLQRGEPNFITVYPAEVPAVTFSADVTSGTVPLTVKLTDSTPGMAAYMHIWDFGDGQQETVNQVPWIWHTYAAAGDYTVTLTIQAPAGVISSTRKAYIHVQPQVLPVSFSASPRTGGLPLMVSFRDTTPNAAGYQSTWNFGDGATSSDVDPVHTYGHAGSYTVTLTLRNAYGASSHSEPAYITVDPTMINVPVVGRYLVSDAPSPAAAIAGEFDPYPPLASSAAGSVVFSTAGYTIGRGYLAADVPPLQGTISAARLRFPGCRFGTAGLPASTVVLNVGTWSGGLPDSGAQKPAFWSAFADGQVVGTAPAGPAQNGVGCIPNGELLVTLDPSYVRSGQTLRLVLRDSQDTVDLTASYPATADPQGRGLDLGLLHLDQPSAWLELTVR